MANLGQRNRLPIVRAAQPGLYLDGGTHGEILLPSRYIPEGAVPGKEIDVFVYRDSEDRLVATTQQPLATVGQFASLRVASYNPRIGFFLEWGLEKDLLLPLREVSKPLQPGDRIVVAVLLDRQTDRLFASTRLNRHLDLSPPPYHEGESVRLLVASKSPLGYNLIVNHAHRGMIYENEAPGLKVGETVAGYIRAIRPDGKLDVALGQAGHRRIAGNTEIVLAKLAAAPHGRLPYHDNSLPEEIREVFGLSKKAFKQAIGTLYKERKIVIDPDGIVLAQPKL